MTHQLVNILEFIIPAAVEAEIHRCYRDSQFDDLITQQIVLKVLNRVPPCYQLLPSECLTPELLPSLPLNSASTTAVESMNSIGQASTLRVTAPTSEPVCSSTLETMLSANTLRQLQAAVSVEVAEHLTSIVAH